MDVLSQISNSQLEIVLVQAVSDLLLVDWSGSKSYGGPSGGMGNEFSAGLMVSTAGNDEYSDTNTLSTSLFLNLEAGEEVHLVALKNPDGKFPYQGHFITFCASLVEKSGTKAAFVGKQEDDFPVLGIRAK